MCRGDGADDGKTESVAVLINRSARIKPLERLEEAFDFSRRNYRARVGHVQEGMVFCRASDDLQFPADDIVAYCIGEQVDDEPLDQQGVSVKYRRFRRFIDMDLESRDLGLEPSKGLLHQGSEVDGLGFTQTTFAAGEGKQRIDQMRLLVVRRKHLFCGGAPFGVARVRIVERNLEEIALGREWGAQFVGSVGNEVLLGVKGTFESRERARRGCRRAP